jgi:hypothetical protein
MPLSRPPIWRRFPLTTIGLVSFTAARFLALGTPPRFLWRMLIIPGYLWSAFSGRLARPFRPEISILGDFFYFVLVMCAYFGPLFVLDLLVQGAERWRRERPQSSESDPLSALLSSIRARLPTSHAEE